MRVSLVFFLCLSCFANWGNEGWLWDSWSSVKSGASRFVGALNPCDQDFVLRSVCGSVRKVKDKVCLSASRWWYETGRIEKAFDVYLYAIFVCGSAVLASVVAPALYAGAWSCPACSYAFSGGIVSNFVVLTFCAYAIGVTVAIPMTYAYLEFFENQPSPSCSGDFSASMA